jgi:serine/threonine protein kinase
MADDSPTDNDDTLPHAPPPDPPSRTRVEPPGPGAAGAGAADRTEAPAAAPGPAELPVVPGYVVVREVARGGMGVVYAARDPVFDREVAVKVVHADQDAGRFVVEAKVTAGLPHPGVPPVYELGTLADGRPFLAMKLIRGRTLAAELEATGRADRPRLLDVVQRICQTVGFAHARGLVHRDLKPSNVMIGSFGEVQVMDWGLARAARAHRAAGPGSGADPGSDPGGAAPAFDGDTVSYAPDRRRQSGEETRAGQVKGTPAYMAPEQARGEAVDARADVFALGGILAAVLTGRPPFAGDTAADTVRRAARAELGECRAALGACGADAELVAVAERCLAARPADR